MRANSIIRRASDPVGQAARFSYQLEPSEVNLIELLSKLPDEITKSANEFKPSSLASYAYEMAKAFNDFYNQCQVLKAEGDVRTSRLMLVKAARICLERTLNLLGIQAPQVM